MQSPASTSSHPETNTQQQQLPGNDGKRRHERRPGAANDLGTEYEIKMAAVTFLRAINTGRDFQLASNIDCAGALDDIVLQFSADHDAINTCYIQLKHKDPTNHKAKVNRDSLICGNELKLSKYYEAFANIKEMFSKGDGVEFFNGDFDSCEFVIFTNAELVSWKENLETRDLPSPVDEYIKLNEVKTNFTEDVVQSFNQEVKKEVEKRNEDIERRNKIKEKQKKPLSQLISTDEEDIKDFLRRVKLFTGQPSEDQLDDVIKTELKEYCKNHGEEYFELMLQRVKDAFKTWHRGEGIILDQKSDILSQALHDAQAEALLPVVTSLVLEEEEKFALDVKFLEDSTASLKDACADQHSLVNVVAEESVRITTNKVLQFLETRKDSCIFVGARCLLKQRHSVMTSWRQGKKHLLVVVSEETANQELDGICTEISQVLQENKDKRIVLVSPPGDSFARQLEEKMGANFTLIQDLFNLNQLHQESIDSILEKRITFQGQITTLGMILGSDLQMISTELKDVLETIIASESLVIGDNLQEDIEYYVPRTMQCKNIVKNKILVDKNFAGRIIIHGATLSDVNDLVPAQDQRIYKRLQQSSDGLVFNYVDLDDNERAAKMSHKDIHYFCRIDGRFVWVKTIGDINYVNNYIDETVSNTVQDPEDRVVLVSAEPGMGKTTLLMHEAQRIKQSHPYTWVVSIALNNYTSLFARVKSQDLKVEEFLESALGVDKLDRALFRFALRHSGKMAVFLDGVDEVAPTYTDQCLTLINDILGSKVSKVWISSRYSMRNTLESHLSTLALSINKFTLEDQKLFLLKFWGSVPGVVKEELDEFIDKILQITAQSVNDKERDFTGIPLQTRMLAEIYQDSISNVETIIIPECLNLLDLIETFVDKKGRTYLKKSLPETHTNFDDMLADQKHSFVQKHITASLLLLFDESDFPVLQTLNIAQTKDYISQMKVDKTGIIDRVVDGKPVFLHRVFAEYYAALWFADNYHSNTEFTSRHLLSDTFGVVRHIFDRILARGSELHTAVLNLNTPNVEDLLSKGIDVNSTDKGGRTALHLGVIAGLHNLSEDKQNISIIKLLITHNARVDVTDEVLKWTPVQYADASELWAEMDILLLNHSRIDLTVFKTTKQLINNDEVWDIVIRHDYANVLHMFIKFRKTQTKSIDSVLKKIGLQQSNVSYFNSNAILHEAAEHGSLEVVRLMIRRAMCQDDESDATSGIRSWFARRAVKKLLIARDDHGKNALIIASEHGKTSVVREILESISADRDRTEYVNTPDDGGYNALLLACSKGYHPVVDLLITSGAIAKAVDRLGRTGVILAAEKGHSTVVKLLLTVFKDDPDRTEFINRHDQYGNSALLLACTHGHHVIVELLLTAGANARAVDKDTRTGIMLASERGHSAVVTSMSAAIQDGRERTEFVNRRDKCDNTALLSACIHGHHACVEELVNAGADIKMVDSNDWSGLMLATCMGHKAVVKTLLVAIDDWRDRTEFVNTLGRCGNTALLLACMHGYRDIFDILIASGAIFSAEESDGRTELMWAARGGHEKLVHTLLISIKNRTGVVRRRRSVVPSQFTEQPQDIADLILTSNITAHDKLLISCNLGLTSVVTSLLALFNDESDKLEFVNADDRWGNTALFCACSRGHREVVDLLIAIGSDVTTPRRQGRNVLMEAILEGHVTLVESLLAAIRDERVRAEFVNERDVLGYTVLFWATSKRETDVVDRLIAAGADVTTQYSRNRSG